MQYLTQEHRKVTRSGSLIGQGQYTLPRLEELKSVRTFENTPELPLIGVTYSDLSIGMEFQILIARTLQAFMRWPGHTARA